MIKAFPLGGNEIIEWSNTIQRLRPDADADTIGKVIDNFLTGEWEFDKEIGIQNIFRGIDELKRTTPSNFHS